MFGKRNKRQGSMQDKDDTAKGSTGAPTFKDSIDSGDEDLPDWTASSSGDDKDEEGAESLSSSNPARPSVSQPLTSNTAPNNPIAGITAPSRGSQPQTAGRQASAATPAPAPEPRRGVPRASSDTADGKQLIVGRGISLSGEITACEKLVVEGTVQADLNDCDTLEIAESGLFKGKATVKNADVYGTVDGELEVSGLLILHGKGQLLGKVRYRDIEVKRGARMRCTIADFEAEENSAPENSAPENSAPESGTPESGTPESAASSD